MSQVKRNILILTDIFKMMGGSEKNITSLITNINHDKFQFIIASFVSGKLAQHMREKGFSVYDLQSSGIYSIKGVKNFIFLRKIVHENNISLIVTYHEGSDFYGLLLSKICNIPVISNRRDMGSKTKIHHKIAYRLLGKFYDAVIAVSDTVKKTMVAYGWFPKNRLFTIYNGVNLRDYGSNRDVEKIKRDIGIREGCHVVGLIANLRRIKGIKYFIEAASIICKQRNNVKFLVIGGDMYEHGCTKEEMEEVARRLDIYEKVHFLGKRSDITDLISIFDVAVNSSLSEGLSNTILEYMASSKPVVATEVGGNTEAVVHGETGFLVPACESHALADAILRILENKEMALKFGRAGRKRAEKIFSLDVMIKKYETIFERVILSYTSNIAITG